MAHPLQQRKLLVTVCKAEIGWDQPDSVTLQSGWVTLVAGPFRASTRSVPVARSPRALGPAGSGAGGASPAGGGGGGLLSWAPCLGGELFVLTEDCVLVADMVLRAELWGHRGGRWNSEALYAQAEICLDAAGQALLLSGRCLEVRLPLMQPQGQGGAKGKGGGGGGGSKAGTTAAAAAAAAAPPPVLGVLALNLLLQSSDAEAAVAQHLPVELVPRLLLDATQLLPGAVMRGATGAAYVDPCVVFLRVRLISASGLGLGAKDPLAGRSSGPGGHHDRAGGTPGRPGHPGLPGPLQDLGARLQSHMDRTMGHVGAFLSRLREHHRGRGRAAEAAAGTAGTAGGHHGQHHHGHGQHQQNQHQQHQHQRNENQGDQQSQQLGGAAAEGAAAVGSGSGRRSLDIPSSEAGGGGGGGGGAREAAVDHAAAEAVMSLLESNGFAVVDNRRLSNYFWCKVSYEGQYHTSRLVAVSGGAVRWDETFIIAALRPVRTAPLEIELYGSNDSKSRGKVVCQLSVPLCDVVDQMYEHHRRRMQEQQGLHAHAHALRTSPPPDQPTTSRLRPPHPLAAAVRRSSRSLQAAYAAAAAAATSVSGAVGGGGGGGLGRGPESESRSRLPGYHPDSWPRGHTVLTARIGGTGGHASATSGTPGGQAAARECRFLLEVEVVDADPRARANATQLLPWAQGGAPHGRSAAAPPPPQPGAGTATTVGTGCVDGGTGAVTPAGGGGVTVTRQGSAGSAIIGFAIAGAGDGAGAEGAEGSRVLSPPWSPVARSVVGGGGGGGGSGLLSPTGGGTGGILSLGALVATSSAAGGGLVSHVSYTPPAPSPPLPGEEDSWLPPSVPPLPHVRGHAGPASVFESECTTDLLAEQQLLDDEGPMAGRSSLAASSAMPSTPMAAVLQSGGAFAPAAASVTAAAAAAVETAAVAGAAAAAPPPPGLCSRAALASSACATLSLVCHDLEVELPPPPEPPVGGSGAVSGGQQAQYAAAVAAITQCDYFVAVRCGSVWLTTSTMRVVGAGGGGGAAATVTGGGGGADGGGHWARLAPHLGLVAPLLKPSTLVSLALFRRTDTMAGRKVLNVRAMIGMVAAEQVVGKLRLRASSLVPGRPATVRLPLKAERSGSRPCATVAWCRLTLLLSHGPLGLAGLLAAYAEPPTYPPVAMLQEGAVAGAGLSDTLPRLDPAKKIDAETLRRRERRLLIKWVSESSPGISAHTSRKLVEDGRTEFNLGRTTQHWRRIGRALSSTEPLKRFWNHVQSWSNPPLTLAVAAGEMALLAWPSRTIAVLLICLVVHLLRLRSDMSPPIATSLDADAAAGGGSGADGNAVDGDAAAAAASGGRKGVGGGGGGGGGGLPAGGGHGRHRGGRRGARTAPGQQFGEPGAMVEDIDSDPDPDPEPAAGQRPTDGEAPPPGGDVATAAAAASGGGGGGGGSLLSAAFTAISQTTTTTSSTTTGASGAAATSTTSTAAALFQMGSMGSGPGPSGGGAAAAAAAPSPSPSLSVTATPTAVASNWIFGSSPPTGGGAGDWWGMQGPSTPSAHFPPQGSQHASPAAARGGGGGGGSEVPKDPLAALRQQYDSMVYFGLRVQNVLDDMAGGMERMQALLSWRDPVATATFALCILLTAAVLWTAGMRVVLGIILLYDMRPPRWRDPWLPPPANAFTHLPTRSDLMM